jgi:hypothetical protein
MAQVGECLLSKCKALSSNSSAASNNDDGDNGDIVVVAITMLNIYAYKTPNAVKHLGRDVLSLPSLPSPIAAH